jgi:monovalent cation:H+ antiporter-2, CPA2 family
MDDASFVSDIAVVLGVAAVTSVVARRLKQPSIVGYLLAGLVVGPYVPLPVFADTHRIEAMAEFGVVLVMFGIGLEFRIGKLLRVLPTSGLTGLLQVSFLLGAGYSLGDLLGWSSIESTFLGGCLAISSTMVVTKVFEEKPVGADVRDLVLGVLVFQDVAAIVIIAVLTAVAAGGGLGATELAQTVGQLAGVLLAMIVGGLVLVPRAVRRVARLKSPEILVVFSVGVCFVLAFLAKQMGYSVALGAFIAGILVAESGKAAKVEHLTHPLRDVFAAIFFVSIGMSVDPRQAAAHFDTSVLLFAVVVAAQLFVITVAGLLSGHGLRRSMTSGLALGQIGEFAFIIAAIGIAAGVVRPSLQPIVVTVAVLTTFTTPLLLGRAERIVGLTDHLLPDRVHHLLTMYEEWRSRTRIVDARPSERTPIVRAIKAIAFDAVTLTALAALELAVMPRLRPWLVSQFSIPRPYATALLVFGTLALAVPLVVGLVRHARALSALVVESVAASQEGGAPIAAAALRAIIYLVLLLAIGLPASAVLRPLGGGNVTLLVVLLASAFAFVLLWRRAGDVEIEFRSAAGRIADALAQQSVATVVPGGAPEPSLAGASLVPGLDLIGRISIDPDSYALGKTLAELNLRARTGANVIAIHRTGGPAILPTGNERLEPGDTLAIAASPEALRDTDALLRDGPRPVVAPPEPTEPSTEDVAETA